MTRIVETDGTVNETGGTLALSGASHATLLVSVATSFNGFDRGPGLDGLDEVGIAKGQLERAAVHSFDDLQERHIRDFKRYYDRVAIELGADPAPGLATDKRLRRTTDGAADPYLEQEQDVRLDGKLDDIS